MQDPTSMNDFLESISKLSLDEQMMISEIVKKRVIEERRKELAKSVSESRKDYYANKTGRGSIDDFISEVENE